MYSLFTIPYLSLQDMLMRVRKSRYPTKLFALTALCVLVSCTESRDAEQDSGADPGSDTLLVYVVNYPLQYFTQRIGSGRVDVRFPAPSDVDPAFWSPAGDDIAGFQRADLILLNGAGYAGWVSRASLPQAKLVDTSTAFHDRLIPIESAVTHTHGPEGEHSHTGTEFTTWLDPTLAIAQAAAIRDALINADPDGKEVFGVQYEALETELVELDARLQDVATGIGNRPLLFSHPVYQYLIRRYGLNGVELHWEPDAMPTDRMWHDLARLWEQHPANWMIWESAPLQEIVSRLEASGIRSVVFDPIGNAPEEGNYLTIMHRNINGLLDTAPTH